MRYSTLTASILSALLLSACAEAPQKDGGALKSPELTPASTPAALPIQDKPNPFRRNIENEIEPQASNFMAPIPLSERLKDLDPREISQEEIDELIALQTEQTANTGAFTKAKRDWAQQDPASRGPKPVYKAIPQTERLKALWYKAGLAKIRKKYGNFDPRVLSKADAEEIIALEQGLAKIALQDQKKLNAWRELDPAIRGARPEKNSARQEDNNPRLQELKSKVRGAQKVEREMDRIVQLSKTHNISILDSELSELIRLQTEKAKFDEEMNTIMTNALVQGQLNPQALTKGQLNGDIIEKLLPRDLLERMFVVGQGIEAIQAPFEAAEKADAIRKQMAKLSETSGFPIAPGDIEETVALNAEKDRIIKRTQLEAGRKWMVEGGPVTAAQNPLPNAEDSARLQTIDARLQAISAPMIETK